MGLAPGANKIGEGGHSIDKSLSMQQRVCIPRKVSPSLRPYDRYGSDIKTPDQSAIELS